MIVMIISIVGKYLNNDKNDRHCYHVRLKRLLFKGILTRFLFTLSFLDVDEISLV